MTYITKLTYSNLLNLLENCREIQQEIVLIASSLNSQPTANVNKYKSTTSLLM